MKLNELKIGQEATITSVDCDEASLRKHILDMGLTPNAKVSLIKVAPLGDPLELLIRGYSLTLRKEDAAKISIKDVKKAEFSNQNNDRKVLLDHPKVGETFSKKELKNTNKNLKFALVGNQNCGKTTLFNALTGMNQHVGNFPGVTVDSKDGTIKNHDNITIVDLPGIYSLSPYTSEEIVTREFILKEKPDCIINIIDATNIERNLYLTMQLLELNVPIVLALNMMDEVRVNGGTIFVNNLESELKVPVVPITACKNEGINELVDHAIDVAITNEKRDMIDFCQNDLTKKSAVHRTIHAIEHLIDDHALRADIPSFFAASKIVEGDELIIKALHLEKNEIETIDHIIKQMEDEIHMDKMAALADMRFSFIESICQKSVIKPHISKERLRSEKIDRILTGKYTAIPVFILIMALVFYLTFGVFGEALSQLMNIGIDYITNLVDTLLTNYQINPVVHSLIIDGCFNGIGSVLSFLPIIVVLFFFLSILEDSGYMARVAFVMDKILRKIGLSGRSFVPMLMGFGCSVPAIMSTRTLPSDRDRKMTILLTPFMSCSAKISIYALFTAAFFKEHAALVMIGLYLFGIIIAILFAFILKDTYFKGEPVPFVMELPNYRLPSPSSVGRLIYDKAKDFITRAFTLIFIASVLIWFLQTFDLRFNVVANSSDSMLASLANIIAPLFKPLGLDDWRISTALITGFSAKESVVSTLSVLLGSEALITTLFTAKTAIVFLVFTLLYTPCVATIATVKKELGTSWAIMMVVGQCVIAWVIAYLVKILIFLI